MATDGCRILCISVLVISIFAGSVRSERTKDKMYESIDGAAACFRRLNGTHQFGCSSRRGGNVGVVAVVETDDDLNWLLSDAPAAPYMVMLPPHMFTRTVLLSLRESGKASGVLLSSGAGSAEIANGFSADAHCPNADEPRGVATCDEARPWNPRGSGLLHEDMGFPIFTVDNADTLQTIRQCYEKHNAKDKSEQGGRSLCAIEMNAFMFAAVDSKTCLRRSNAMNNINPIRYCDPLGDRNVWSTLFAHETQRPVLVLSARLDATSLFDGLAPGAGSPAAGVVTLLATASLLAEMLPPEMASTTNANVLFALFHGEAHGLIGSSRAAYDMSRDEFPAAHDPSLSAQAANIGLNDLTAFLELGQLAGGNGLRELFSHSAKGTGLVMVDLLRRLKSEAAALGLAVRPASNPPGLLPPASLSSFVKRRPDLPGVVLAGHDTQFTNKFYHSQYDDAQHLGLVPGNITADSVQQLLGNLSLVLAKAVYGTLTGKDYTGRVDAANFTLVDELLRCHLVTYNCSLFRAATPPGQSLPATAPSHYVGVSVSGNLATVLSAQALALLTGQRTARTKDDCLAGENNTLTQFIWMSAWMSGAENDSGVCVETTMNYAPAVSPAFVIDGYDWSSGEFSTWTESIWREFSVRLFLVPSAAHEWATLCIGAVVMIASTFAIAFVARKADTLFTDNTVLAAAC